MSKNDNALLLELQRLRTENHFLSRDLESFHKETKYWRELYDESVQESGKLIVLILFAFLIIVPVAFLIIC